MCVRFVEVRGREQRFPKHSAAKYRQGHRPLGLLRLGCCNKDLASGERTFTAIISRGRPALPSLATISGFFGQRATEAVEGFKQQEDRYQADRDVNATPHPI